MFADGSSADADADAVVIIGRACDDGSDGEVAETAAGPLSGAVSRLMKIRLTNPTVTRPNTVAPVKIRRRSSFKRRKPARSCRSPALIDRRDSRSGSFTAVAAYTFEDSQRADRCLLLKTP